MPHLKSLFFTLIFFLSTAVSLAQQRVSGTVVDEAGQPLPGIIVKVYDAEGKKMLGYATTGQNGLFGIALKEDAEHVTVRLSGMGYAQVDKTIDLPADLGKVVMREVENDMREVTVKAPPVRTHGDTISYNVAQVKSPTDRKIEDVIKRLPGIEVESSGVIKYNGKPINKFYIEGADMLGGRYSLATRNIDADDIATINVYENHQPKRALEGIEFSDRAALNLTLKQQRMLKPIGKVSLGGGYGDGPLWNADAYTLLIAPKNQFLITAKGNSMAQFYADELANHISSSTSYRPYAQGVLNPLLSSTTYVSPTRSQTNRSASTTYNSLHKLAEDVKLVVNAGYHFDRRCASTQKRTSYWQGGADAVVVDENSDSRGRSHQGWLTLQLESNKRSLYLNETLDLEGQLQDNRDLIGGTSSVRQDIHAGNYLVKNNLQAIWRRNGRAFNVSSDISFASAEETLVFNEGPLASLTGQFPDSNSTVLCPHEKLTGQKMHTMEETSYKWVLSRYVTVSANATLQADYDRLGTNLEQRGGNDASRYGGYMVRTSVYPSIQLTQTALRGRVDFLLHMTDLHYTNRLDGARYDYDQPQLGLRGNFYYDLFHHVKMQFGGSHMRAIGTMKDFVITPIYTDYRNRRVFGTGLLSSKDKTSANLGLNYRNTLAGINASLDALYQHTRGNLLSGSDVSASQNSTTFREQKNDADMWQVNANCSRNVYQLHTILALRGSLSFNRMQTLRQGTLSHIANDIYSLGGNVQTTLFAQHLVVSLDGQYTLSAQRISQLATSTLQHDFNFLASTTVFPLRGWGLYVRCNGASIDRTDLQFYLDAGTQYLTGHFELELSARNLTNRRQYVVRQLSSCDSFEYIYNLRPLEACATIRYSF